MGVSAKILFSMVVLNKEMASCMRFWSFSSKVTFYEMRYTHTSAKLEKEKSTVNFGT